MKVYRSAAEVGEEVRAASVTIGSFDGVHIGHQALLERTVELGESAGATPLVLTFDPHPARFFDPEQAPPLITTERQKLQLLEDNGIEATVVEPFDRRLTSLSPGEFVEQILVRRLHTRHVVVGTDFGFGRRRSGNLATLEALGAEHGFQAHGIEPVRLGGLSVSSTRVREAVQRGDMDEAAELLGRPLAVEGDVVAGHGRGRTIGIPTANLESDNELIPARGVYAAWAATADARRIPAVVNIGRAPTFETAGETRIEAHLLDFDENLRDAHLALEFVRRLRDERRFSGPEQLVEAIHADIARARDLLSAG